MLSYYFNSAFFINFVKNYKMAKTEEKLGLNETREALNKQYGPNTIIQLNAKARGEYDVIPTGSLTFDNKVLGIGGFAKGRIYEIRGWEGVGKSTICGHAAAECQKKGGTVLYIDGEFALDTDYFGNLGVNVNSDKFLICQPDNGDVGFEVAIKLIETGEIDLVIIDSDSSLLPQAVLENPVGASNIGKKAKLNSDVYPKFKGLVHRNNTCMLITSQYREKIGVMFGDPKVTQGGKALGFWADCIIELSKKAAEKESKDADVIEHTLTMKTIKNKTYSPFKKGSVNVKFGVGLDKIADILDLANEFGIIKIWGKTITYKDFKYLGTDFIALLTDNDDFKTEITNVIKEKLAA